MKDKALTVLGVLLFSMFIAGGALASFFGAPPKKPIFKASEIFSGVLTITVVDGRAVEVIADNGRDASALLEGLGSIEVVSDGKVLYAQENVPAVAVVPDETHEGMTLFERLFAVWGYSIN